MTDTFDENENQNPDSCEELEKKENPIAAAIDEAEEITDPLEILAERAKDDDPRQIEILKGDDAKALIEELATLETVEYEQRRKHDAKLLDMRASVLDREVEKVRLKISDCEGERDAGAQFMQAPRVWPNEVDGAEWLETTIGELKRYAILPDYAAETIALWCLFTHCHDAARHSPLLTLTSPTKRCGKTTVLNLIRLIVPKPLPASNASTAAIFRAIEKYRPTLLVDEAETFLNANDELRGIINASQFREAAFVLRAEGDDHEPKQFSVWSPKVLALIGRFPDTLEDRAINITLRRKTESEAITFFDEAGEGDFAILMQQAARWAQDNLDSVKRDRPDFPNDLKKNSRTCDNWRTILSIADVIGGKWSKRARDVALAISAPGIGADDAPGIQLLQDIRAIFEYHHPPVDRLHTSTILSKLAAISDSPWAEWKNGKPISAHTLGRMLASFGITSSTMRIGEANAKGYSRTSFRDAWDRYLPKLENSKRNSVTNSRKQGVSDQNQSVTNDPMLRIKNDEKQQNSGVCDAVTLSNPENESMGACGNDLNGIADKTGQVGAIDIGMPDLPPFLDRRRDKEGQI